MLGEQCLSRDMVLSLAGTPCCLTGGDDGSPQCKTQTMPNGHAAAHYTKAELRLTECDVSRETGKPRRHDVTGNAAVHVFVTQVRSANGTDVSFVVQEHMLICSMSVIDK